MQSKAIACVAAMLLTGTVAANAIPYVVTMDQVGANVVATGSGQIDLTGLTLVALQPLASVAGVEASSGTLGLSSGGSILGGNAPTEYFGFTGPTTFGLGGFFAADSSSGSPVLMSNQLSAFNPFPQLGVPNGYTSDSALAASTDTWNRTTLAALGVTPGTYIWTWGTGLPDQSFTLEIGQTPLPAALPLFATGIGGLGLLGWRRKRKAQA